MYKSRGSGELLMTGVMLLVLAATACGAAVVQHDVVSPPTDGALQVDGVLDEPAWGQAAELGELVTLGTMLAPREDHTGVRLMHDAQALYIGVDCAAGPAAAIPSMARNDRRVYNHERIEVFFSPRPDSEEYYQVVVDRAGNIRATRLHPGVIDEPDTGWGMELEAATTEREGGWTAELMVPFALIGAESPEPGALYRLKVCRDGGREGALSWPPNPTGSFHRPEADGALYFTTMNLLVNGDFEDGDAQGRHVPPPWSAAMTSPEVDNEVQGTVETVAGAGIDGGRAVHKTKLLSALWWPQIWSPLYLLEPGGAYEFSVMVRGTLPQVNLRASMHIEGRRVARLADTFDTPADWERLSYSFRVSEQANEVNVGLSAPHLISGEVYYDQAVLRRVLMSADQMESTPIVTYDPDPDPVQGLSAFMERSGVKPYDLFWRDDSLLTTRLIFRDRKFGTEVWMLDTSPAVDHCGTASVWPAWNANATMLHITGRRPVTPETTGAWVFNHDYSRLSPHTTGIWDRRDPDVRFIHRAGQLTRANTRTGESEVIAQWQPYPRERVYGLTRDNRYIFLDTPNGGMWVTYTPGENPIPPTGLHDGRPEAPNEHGTAPDPHLADNILTLNHQSAVNTEQWGPIFCIRVGILIDRETGEMEKVIVPLSGNEEYLRTFNSDRVNFPTGGVWDEYRKHTSDDIDELFEIYRYFPVMTHGHESPSPDWEHFAKDGDPTRIIRTRDGYSRNVRLSANSGNYHVHWVKHPRFFVGWVRGWGFVSFARPHNANIEFQAFSDETSQPIVDTKHRFNGYYSGGDFAMQSPDATKIHYGSSMTGRFRNYVAVMARPRPPLNPAWQAEGAAVALTWEAPPYSREIRGYLVYRAEQSGDGYRLLTPEPVAQTAWRDDTVEAGRAYYYVVTSLEHSGLESGYSEEIARAGINLPAAVDAPLVVYVEPEAAIRDLATAERPGLAMGVDRPAASDWYYLYRHPRAESGAGALTVNIPAAGTYHLWARVASGRVERTVWQVSLAGADLEAATGETEWTWERAGEVTLPAGPVEVTVATAEAQARLDLLCLATDPGFTPEGPRPENTVPPPAVTGLAAHNVGERVNHLTWEPVADPTLSHYQVYASTAPITSPAQELLIGSPTYGEFIDWGLRAGTVYHYAVTAVDRRGNESPLATAQAATPDGPEPVTIALTFDTAEREGPFELSEAGDTHGAAYVVAEDPENNAVTWQIEVPREDDYSLWLRYLHRGSGGRGDKVSQNRRVFIGERQSRTLGGGLTDLHIPDALIAADHPLATQVWTWAWPGLGNLERVRLPAGTHTLRIDTLAPGVRYDALVLTTEPSWVPEDGRLRQR